MFATLDSNKVKASQKVGVFLWHLFLKCKSMWALQQFWSRLVWKRIFQSTLFWHFTICSTLHHLIWAKSFYFSNGLGLKDSIPYSTCKLQSKDSVVICMNSSIMHASAPRQIGEEKLKGKLPKRFDIVNVRFIKVFIIFLKQWCRDWNKITFTWVHYTAFITYQRVT